MNTFKKALSLTMAAALAAGCLTGCGEDKMAPVSKDGKVRLYVGGWPDSEAQPESYATRMKQKAEFEEKYPDVEIVGDTYTYDTQTFAAKAEGGTLPTIYSTHFTEVNKIMELGYAADITKQMKDNHYYDVVSDTIMKEITKDEKVYFIPAEVYSLGLVMNLNMFKEAGLVNADGTPIFPETFDDVKAMAKTIHDKTGKAGFVFPTTQNGGGWNFTSLAWSFGGTFMKENGDKWESDFNEGTTKALEWLKSLMWEDGSLPATTLVTNDDTMKLVGTDQAAMTFAHPAQVQILVGSYGMEKDAIGYAAMPAGTDGKVTLMGGAYYAISPVATEEQKDAAFKWLQYIGATPSIELTEEKKANMRLNTETSYNKGNSIIGIYDLSLWTDKEATQGYSNELKEEFRNIPVSNVSSFNNASKNGMKYHVEEKACTQDLYGILDSCLQEVLTNKDADCAAVLEKAASDFQNNFLNNM